MPVGVSYHQLFRVPFILRILERYHAPGSLMSQYYGVSMTGGARNVQRIIGNTGQYEIFDGTRSLAPMSAKDAPPTSVNRKPVGTQPITVPRQYNRIGVNDNELFGTRDLGRAYSQPVASRGQAYFARQVNYLQTRMMNNMEFMLSRMFDSGFDIKPLASGSSQLVLDDAGSGALGAVTNQSLVPAANKGQIGGIIATSWANPTANIPEQFQEIQKRAAQVNGRRITDVWLNGTTFKHLLTNSVIQAVGGSVNRIFNIMDPSSNVTDMQRVPDTGYSTVVFGGLPDIRFHVYNQGYVTPGTDEQFANQTGANWTPFIPDNVAIMTPAPGDWLDMVEGSELVQFNLSERNSKMVMGWGVGSERSIEPPRTDVKMLYNGAPVIVEPYAVYYATVIF